MSHKPIIIQDIAVHVGQKALFEHFSTQIQSGKRIIILGANGAGKSTLLKIIQGSIEPTHGRVLLPPDITFGYVPQTVVDYPLLSGGQRFNKALSQALIGPPDVLCLDEPTNHLDAHNKQSLLRLLASWHRTLIIISHDEDVLALPIDELWHIEHGSISIYKGSYADYRQEHAIKQQSIVKQKQELEKQKRTLKKKISEEHQRAAHSKAINKDEKDRTLLGMMKESGSRSTGKQLGRFAKQQEQIAQSLQSTVVHEVIKPHFHLDARRLAAHKSIVSIADGACGYQKMIVHDINLQLKTTERIVLIGDNGSGKSTLLKAILSDPAIVRSGDWLVPPSQEIGYLDQHYSTLNPALTVFENMQHAMPAWKDQEVRKHLNNFLFRKPEEVDALVQYLSGGEKARLSLAIIAAQNPYVLLLDEITNNIDHDTRMHLIEVLHAYPGAMILVSHEQEFLDALGVQMVYKVSNGTLKQL